MYTGTMLPDLNALVDNTLVIYGVRCSSVTGSEPWEILHNARLHLCGGADSLHSKYPHMDQADVKSWYFFADLQDAMIGYSLMDKVRDESLGD